MRLVDYLMHRLAEAGASHVFQVTGRGSLFLSDGLAKSDRLQSVSLHHEQSCAFAAVAHAEQSGTLGVCLVSTGCASTNTLTGVLSAWQDGIPCVFISGQNILRETSRFTGVPLRTYGQQETDIVGLVTPITKLARMITKPDEIAQVVDELLAAACSGRKGPVWLDIPLDLQSALVDPESLPRSICGGAVSAVAEDDVKLVLDTLNKASRPLVLIGSGVRSAGAEGLLRDFIARWNLPVTYTGSAADTYGSGEPLSIGSVGAMGCSRAGNFAVQNADFVLVLGSRLSSLATGPDFCKFARAARTVVVDIDPIEHSKDSIRIDHFVQSDVGDLLERLNDHEPINPHQEWIEKCQHWKALFNQVEPAFSSDDRVDLYQLADRLSRVLPTPSTLVTDSGLAEVILPTNVRFRVGMRCIHPASQGSMGFALPAAIGAQFGTEGDAPVVAVIGDGSIMMNLQELESIRYHQLPIKIIVINNDVYSIIRRRQVELFRKRTIGTDPSNGLSCPDFSLVAHCFGIDYMRVDQPRDLDQGLAQMLSHAGPVLCEIMGRPDQGYIDLGQTRGSDGRFVRRPLEDQEPFLPRDVFLREMLVDPIDQ